VEKWGGAQKEIITGEIVPDRRLAIRRVRYKCHPVKTGYESMRKGNRLWDSCAVKD